MKVVQSLWTIEDLIKAKSRINLNPAWQRGPAWSSARRVLLIDSILRSMDVPKIYLRKLSGDPLHDYEAVDGQQRLRAVWDFVSPANKARDHGYALKTRDTLTPINGVAVADQTFNSLPKELRDRLLNFQVGVGEIIESTNDEIAVLFARLQMGMPLNPAELRNADLGPMRNMIQLMTKSHEFFTDCRIKDDRTRHFDFATYAFAIAHGMGKHDMKAADLRELQRDYNARPMEEIAALSARVGSALNILAEVDQLTRYRIVRKWIFVDLLHLILLRLDEGVGIDVKKLADRYDSFEERRRLYTGNPDQLLNDRRRDAKPLDRSLYDYLFSFRTEGAKAASISKRVQTMARFFKNIEAR